MHNDPTEFDPSTPPPPPPSPGDNPYSASYYPIPPKQTQKGLMMVVVCLLCLVVVLGGALLAVLYRDSQQGQKGGAASVPSQTSSQARSTVTATPTATPAVVTHYTAYQIVKKISGAINIQNASDTSNVSGNTGMVQFEISIDANSPVDLFLGTYETKEEATNAMNYYTAIMDGPGAVYQYNYCMLIYSPMPSHILTNVVQQVNEYCV